MPLRRRWRPVASVIRNRLAAGGYGRTPSEIVHAPSQVEAWDPPSGEGPELAPKSRYSFEDEHVGIAEHGLGAYRLHAWHRKQGGHDRVGDLILDHIWAVHTTPYE